MKTALEVLNEVIPNRGMNNDELNITAMEEYANEQKKEFAKGFGEFINKYYFASAFGTWFKRGRDNNAYTTSELIEQYELTINKEK